MADDRPVEEPTDQLGRLQRELDDLKSTMLARVVRRPTGDVEPTIRLTPKEGTLLLQGQTVSRATYPNLWTWVQDAGLAPTVFGTGDGSTTFVLPDMRGKAAVGATSVDPVGKSFGSATQSLTEAQLPRHRHDGTTGWSDRTHIHGGNTDGGGNHGSHVNGWVEQPGYGVTNDPRWTRVSSWSGSPGDHIHHFTSATESQGHLHGFTTNYSGSANPDPFFVVQPSYAVNWLIWI